MDETAILTYLKETYRPLAIIACGSYAAGDADAYSDYDCTVIVTEKTKKHDGALVGGVRLDCYLFTVDQTQTEDPDLFLPVHDGAIRLDTGGVAAALVERVRAYVREHTVTDPEDKAFIASWIRKTMHRAEKNDDEGSFRALAFLWESLTDYCLLRDRFYFGSKKTARLLQETDPEGYRLYHLALTERTNAAIAAWADYVAAPIPRPEEERP